MEFKQQIYVIKRLGKFYSSISVIFMVIQVFTTSALTTNRGFRDCFDKERQLYYGKHNHTDPRHGDEKPCMQWEDVLNITNGSNGDDSWMRERNAVFEGNFCRFTKPIDRYPRCFFETDDGELLSDWCAVSPCTAHSGCMNGNGYDYRDAAMYTQSGYKCLQWEDMENQSVNPETYPISGLDGNSCRNPNNKSSPWCYYQKEDSSIDWDYCSITQCETDVLSKFNRAVHTYILGYNRKYILDYNMTAEKCAIGCLSETSFVCRTFELREVWPHDNRTCIMTDESLYTLDQYKAPRLGSAIDLFTRIDTICDAYRAPRIPNDCPLPVGVENGFINDTQITASSFLEGSEPFKGRLNSNTSWIPFRNTDTVWLQVEFPQRMLITGVIIQGGGDQSPFWVEQFKLKYSEGDYWWIVKDAAGKDKTFRANGEPHCSRPVILDRPIRATSIRLVPTSWNGSISIRIDVIGCLDDDCHLSSGIAGGSIRKTQLMSSTSSDSSHIASDARLNPYHPFGRGWVPYQPDTAQWIQVSLDNPWNVNEIVTQGCGDLSYWVLRFSVSYLVQDGVWQLYRHDQDFPANSDQHTLVSHKLDPPITSNSIKIQPLAWHENICLRFEIFGCRQRLCSRRLGMESGAITNEQISATSYYRSQHPTRGRLHHPSYWEASHVLNEEWIQIDLIDLHTITGIITQGRGRNSQTFWVKTYVVYYESQFHKRVWRTYRNLDGEEKIFVGNYDENSEVRNDFERPIMTKRIRISPRAWHSSLACMRLELLGCLYEDVGDFCSENAVDYEGFCIGVVDSQDTYACDVIFAEGSQPITINGGKMQEDLENTFNDLKIEDRDAYKIGLKSIVQITLSDNVTASERPSDKTPINKTFEWTSNKTPITYEHFKNLLQDTQNRSIDYCVSLNSYDFKWSAYPCNDKNKPRATLCQKDINECVGGKAHCSHTCLNYPGGYSCTCPTSLYLDNYHNCSQLCPMLDTKTPVQGGSRCFTHLTKASWSEAVDTCALEGLWTVTVDDVTDQDLTKICRELFIKENEWIWVLSESNNESLIRNGSIAYTPAPTTMESMCTAVTIATEDVTQAVSIVQMRDCDDIASAMCVQDFDDIRCEQMILNNVTSTTESTSLVGYIQSLNFAPWYNSGSNCVIRFIAPQGLVYRFRFVRMSLRRPALGKCLDALKLTDNIPGRGRVHRGTYCGQKTDLVVVSKSNDVLWELSIGDLTADMDNEIGLVVFFEAIECRKNKESCYIACDANNSLTSFPGTFSSYNFPAKVPPFTRCRWVIEAPEGAFIRLHISDFRVECIDKLYIIENQLTDTHWETELENLQGFCDKAPPLYVSRTSTLTIVFSTGLDATSLGFKAEYEMEDIPGCGYGQTSEAELQCHYEDASFASLYYPKSYLNHEDTSWAIVTSPGTYIELQFLDFDIPSPLECFPGRLVLFDSARRSKKFMFKFCNENRPKGVIESSRNALFLEYISHTHTDFGIGFYAEYHARVFSPTVVLQPTIGDNKTETFCDNKSWINVNQNCYRLFTMAAKIHWNDAQQNCSQYGANLVSIRIIPEVNFIQKMLVTEWFTGDRNTYIGLTDRVKEDHFVWIDGSPMSYTDWSTQFESDARVWRSQPDGDNLEDCTMIILDTYHSTANWHDVSCASKEAKQFICKKPAKGASRRTEIGAINMNMTAIEDEQPTCDSKLITCSNGECIHPIYTCPGQLMTQCEHTDEHGNCLATYSIVPNGGEIKCSLGFTCDNSECISLSVYCDFINDCSDYSDEKYCTYRNCTANELRCSNGECISEDHECNLIPDCIDGSDEGSFCSSCNDGFQCYDGSCIPKRAYCDSHKDCPGNHWEDEPPSCEYHLHAYTCTESQLFCLNRECINETLKCMYEFDEYGYHLGCRDVTHLRSCEDHECPLWTIKCHSSFCIPLRYRCNDVIDCPGGEDENNCKSFTCPGAYRCHTASFCVNPDELCDGIQQCPMGDDEMFCDITCPEGCFCSGLSFECHDVTWSSSVAANIPNSIRKINLVGVTGTRQRRSTDSVSGNITVEYVLHAPLARFPLLADLDLSQNGITILGSGTFSNLRNLIRLSFSFNKITQLQRGTFSGLHLLTYLNLTGNPLTIISAGAFLQLKKLPNLDLSGMDVTILLDGTFRGLAALQNLTLKSGALNQIVPGAFEGLKELKEIDIRGNPLNLVEEEIFRGLTRINILKSDRYLFCCLIGDIESCMPEADQFSSCADLMRNPVLRVCIWILGLSALIGNIFVILWRTKIGEETVRSKVQDYLILNLAAADLMMGVYMITIASADMYYRDVYILHADKWQSGAICKLAGLLSTLSCELSLFILAVISVDRFWCITFGVKGYRRLQLEHAHIITVIAWVIALILSIIPVLGLKYFGDDFYGRSSVCLALPLTSDHPPGWEYSVMLFLGVNLFSFLVICFCYLNIYCTVYRTSKRMRRSKKRAAEIKMAARMAFIVATDFACWMPIFIMAILSMTGAVTLPGDVYAWTAVFILPLNSALNPFLYTFSNVNIRRHIQALIGDQSTDTAGELSVNRTQMSPLRSMISINNVPARILLSEMEKRSDLLFMRQSDIASIKSDLSLCLRYLHQKNVACGVVNQNMIMMEQDKQDKWHAGLILTCSTGVRLKGPNDTDDIEELMKENINQIEEIVNEISNTFTGESCV